MSKTKGEKSAVRENTIDEKRAMRRRRNKRKKEEKGENLWRPRRTKLPPRNDPPRLLNQRPKIIA